MRLLAIVLLFGLVLLPGAAAAQGVFCHDLPQGCDRTGTVAESWLRVALVVAALAATWLAATRRVRRVSGVVVPALARSDPLRAATEDRERNAARVSSLASLAAPSTQRRTIVEGSVLGLIVGLLIAVWLGLRTGGEWSLILAFGHFVVFAVVLLSGTVLAVEASERAVRALFGLGVAGGFLVGWLLSWYVLGFFV